jgi:hypothetical protein
MVRPAGTASSLSRLPVTAFSVLVAATVAAFFITQHLKVTTPFLAGFPRPVPPVVDPVHGKSCGSVSHARMSISFYLLHQADDVDVSVVDARGAIVRTLASGVHMVIKRRAFFTWNGREDNGSFAPDGTYFVRVALIHQGRTVTISGPAGPESFKIQTTVPMPRITSVTPRLLTYGARAAVTIRYAGNETRSAKILIYRLGARGRAQLVKSFVTPWHRQSAVWDGLIRKRPAPRGAYRIAVQVIDGACNTGTSAPAALAVH